IQATRNRVTYRADFFSSGRPVAAAAPGGPRSSLEEAPMKQNDLRRQIEEWIADGSVDPETGRRLLARADDDEDDASARANAGLLGLGGHLLGFGIVFFLGMAPSRSALLIAQALTLIAAVLIAGGVKLVRGPGDSGHLGRALV